MATRLDLNYDAQVEAVRSKVHGYALRVWNGSPSYRDDDAERIIALLVPRIEAGQTRIAQLTDAYIARLVANENGGGIQRGVVADVSTEEIRGIPAEEVYRRPFITAYTDLAEGATLTLAIAAGAARLSTLVNTGMQLARTHSARQAGERTGVEVWLRVLTGRENCDLCATASTQRYYRGDLMPIHGNCDCIPKPAFGNANRAPVESDESLTRVVTNIHSEVGPTLGWENQHFTTAEEIGL